MEIEMKIENVNGTDYIKINNIPAIKLYYIEKSRIDESEINSLSEFCVRINDYIRIDKSKQPYAIYMIKSVF